MVCFCDIPINDLHIHIKKYTPFGISFDKSFLIKNGANPMFYISNNSLVHKIGGNDKIKLSEGYDYIRHEFHYILTASANFLKNNIPDITTERVMHLYHFINYYMFSFLKFFDAKKSDDDKDNFYMEREWRILGDLSFSLEDVERIILPRAYGKKIREDLPEYCGQISFVD